MMFSSAYSQLASLERQFVDECIFALVRKNADYHERLTATLERFAQAIDLDSLDDRRRDLFAKPIVRAAIHERVQTIAAESDLTAARVIKEHAAIGFASLKRFFPEIGDDGIPQFDATEATPEDWAALASLDIEEVYTRAGTKRTIKLKMHNKQTSLDALAKYMGLDKADNADYAAYKALPSDLDHMNTSATVEQLADVYARHIEG